MRGFAVLNKAKFFYDAQKQTKGCGYDTGPDGREPFPGKPLVPILGLPMIEHVRRRVTLCPEIDEVYVATCDQEIKDVVEQFKGRVLMTAPTHARCTDRVEEAAGQVGGDIILIFQGDEPLFDLSVADHLLRPFWDNPKMLCTNLISTIKDEADLADINIVKAVLNLKQDVLCFSRASIPYKRVETPCALYRQTGLSAFQKDFLIQFSQLDPTPLGDPRINRFYAHLGARLFDPRGCL